MILPEYEMSVAALCANELRRNTALVSLVSVMLASPINDETPFTAHPNVYPLLAEKLEDHKTYLQRQTNFVGKSIWFERHNQVQFESIEIENNYGMEFAGLDDDEKVSLQISSCDIEEVAYAAHTALKEQIFE